AYAGVLDRLLAGDAEVVIAASYPGNATVFMQEARDLYGFGNWMMTDGTKSLDIVQALGADAVEGLFGTAPGADPEWEGYVRFSEAYEAAFGERPPLPYIDTAYDAVAVIGLAMAKAYIDGVEINASTIRERLREVANPEGEVVGVGDFEEAIRLLQIGSPINYTGAAGEVDFDELGDVVTPVEVWQYQGGEIVTNQIRTADQIPAQSPAHAGPHRPRNRGAGSVRAPRSFSWPRGAVVTHEGPGPPSRRPGPLPRRRLSRASARRPSPPAARRAAGTGR